MCYTDCFLIYFTIRAGAACVSTILLALGMVGFLAIPFLPFSSNEAPFYLVMAYMALLVVAFTMSLCGTLVDSRWTAAFGLVLGIVAFLFWALLTVPTLISFASDSSNNFCLGNYCGESHWLVPRDWKAEEFQDRTSPSALDFSIGRFNPFRRLPSPPKYEITASEETNETSINSPGTGHRKNKDNLFKMEDHTPGIQTDNDNEVTMEITTLTKEDEEMFELAESIINGDRQSSISEKLNRLILGNEINTSGEDDRTEKHRDLGKYKEVIEYSQILNVQKYLAEGKSKVTLDRLSSIGLALIYAFLFCCSLGTMCMNMASFTSKGCEDPPPAPRSECPKSGAGQGDRKRRCDKIQLDCHSSYDQNDRMSSESDRRPSLKSDRCPSLKSDFHPCLKSDYHRREGERNQRNSSRFSF